MSNSFQKFQDEDDFDDDNSQIHSGQLNGFNQLQDSRSQKKQQELYESHNQLNQQKNNQHQQSYFQKYVKNSLESKDDKQQSEYLKSADKNRNGNDKEVNHQNITKNVAQDLPFMSEAVQQTLLRIQQPTKYLLIYEGSLLMLKISRIILVLGLLIKLFFEMSCTTSSIHSLLVCSFFRDVISGILDLQLIFKICEVRYKINKQHFDKSLQKLGRDILRSKRETQIASQQVLGRFTQRETIDQLQQATTYEVFEVGNAISNLMPTLSYFSKILKYSYHLLFLISVVFIIRYDDEQFCHVFEKYTIIYLFLPIYVLFLVIFLCLTFLGVFLTIVLVLLLGLIAKYIHGKYKQQKQQQINEIRAKNLEYVLYSTLQNQIENAQCAVCLNNYNLEDQITILKCSPQHHFHYSCLQKWILLKGQCPSCRSENII